MMSDKSVLVIDTPRTCIECKLQYGGFCFISDEEDRVAKTIDELFLLGGKPTWCPLIPLPKKAAVDESMLGIGFDDFNTIYYLGFNECIDKITGETE